MTSGPLSNGPWQFLEPAGPPLLAALPPAVATGRSPAGASPHPPSCSSRGSSRPRRSSAASRIFAFSIFRFLRRDDLLFQSSQMKYKHLINIYGSADHRGLDSSVPAPEFPHRKHGKSCQNAGNMRQTQEFPPLNMSTPSNPSEIARETLRQLALRRIAPRRTTTASSITRSPAPGPTTTPCPKPSCKLARRLPRDSAERQRHGHQLDQALADGRDKAAEATLERYLDSLKLGEPQAWNELIGNLLRQWEARQTGWTPARKREALDRVLGAADPAALAHRLQGLLKSWTQAMTDADALAVEVPDAADEPTPALRPAPTQTPRRRSPPARTAAAAPPASIPGVDSATIDALRELVTISLGEAPAAAAGRTTAAARDRRHALRRSCQSRGRWPARGRHACAPRTRARLAAADEAEIRAGMLELLRMLLRNIDELVLDDRWLAGQIEMLREIVTAVPTRARSTTPAAASRNSSQAGPAQAHPGPVQRHLRDMLAGLSTSSRASPNRPAPTTTASASAPSASPGQRHHRDRPPARRGNDRDSQHPGRGAPLARHR